MPTVDGVSPKRVEVNLHELEILAGLQCTQEDIAGRMGISKSALERTMTRSPEHRAAYEKGKANIRAKLRQTVLGEALGVQKHNADGTPFLDEHGAPVWLRDPEPRALKNCMTHMCNWRDSVDVRTGDIVDNGDPIQEMLEAMAKIDATREEGESDE